MNIVSRADWGARPPRSVQTTFVEELFLHHSVGYQDGGAAYMREMQRFHMDIRGWSDIAYNHAYDPQRRTFYEGRGWGVRPGSQKSYNSGTHSLVVMGNFGVQTVTAAMVEDIAGFYRHAHSIGRLPQVTVRGHKDAPNQNTTCPGSTLYAALPQINQLIEEDEMPTAEEIAAAVWSRNIQSGITAALALDRNYRNISELVIAHRAGTLGADAELSPDDIAAIVDAIVEAGIASEVADELANRLIN